MLEIPSDVAIRNAAKCRACQPSHPCRTLSCCTAFALSACLMRLRNLQKQIGMVTSVDFNIRMQTKKVYAFTHESSSKDVSPCSQLECTSPCRLKPKLSALLQEKKSVRILNGLETTNWDDKHLENLNLPFQERQRNRLCLRAQLNKFVTFGRSIESYGVQCHETFSRKKN